MSTSVSSPIYPFSRYPEDPPYTYPRIFRNPAGPHSKEEGPGLGYKAGIDTHGADVKWELRFAMPPVIPLGEIVVILWALADSRTGSAKIVCKWAPVAPGETPSNPPVAMKTEAETATFDLSSVTFQGYYLQEQITLDNTGAYAVAANDILVMDLVAPHANWAPGEGGLILYPFLTMFT